MIPRQWQTYPLAYQMGNIGSEVSRMISLKARDKKEETQSAFERALDLLDMTIADSRRKSSLSELLRLREVVCGFMLDSDEYEISGKVLNSYFLPYAVMARSDGHG